MLKIPPSILILSLLMAVVYCLLPPENPSPAAASYPSTDHRYGGTLVWGTRNPASMLNPILWNQDSSAALNGLIFNALVRIDSRGDIIPDLAETWDVSDDRLTYIFHIRKGVRFHDGTALTAEDVKFTYDMIRDPSNRSPWRTNTELVQEWEVLDSYTLRMKLREPFPSILFQLIREVVPKHLLEGRDLRQADFNYAPVGSGPFRFLSWDKLSGEIMLEANAEYYEGRPYLDKILVKSYPDNDSLWAALMRQEVDLVKFLNREDYLVIKKDDAFKSYAINWKMFCAMVYDIQDPLLSDIHVRRAIAHSIHREGIIDAVSGGAGVESTGPFHPDSVGFNDNVQPLQYDPQEALRILRSRGWRDNDNDGILEKNGKELTLKVLVDSRGEFYQKMAAVMRQQLSEIGIRLQVQLYHDESELTKEYLQKHQAQAWLRFFTGVGFDGFEPIKSWYSLSSESVRIWNYKNPAVDRLFEVSQKTREKDARVSIYQEVHKIIYDDQPACFLFYPLSFHAVSVRFQNTDEFFSPHMPDYILKNWYVAR